MRKLLLPAVAIVSLVLACENKTPSGPGEVTITETTTSTSTTTTTTTVPPGPTTVSTTTTSVVGATQRRYITTGGAANVPFDMQLIYQLIGGALTAPSFIERLPLIGEAFATATEIRYKVTGTYVTPSGATGSVEEICSTLGPAAERRRVPWRPANDSRHLHRRARFPRTDGSGFDVPAGGRNG